MAKVARDYMLLLPEEGEPGIDFSRPLTVKRKGRLAGSVDEIPFTDETLDMDERIWSAGFTQWLNKTYGPSWESKIDEIETIELDYDMSTFQELFYFPNLKKVVLGKNRYMNEEHTTENLSLTDDYSGLMTLQYLRDIRGVETEVYNGQYFIGQCESEMLGEMPWTDLLSYAGKIDYNLLDERGSANLSEMPQITPLDTTGWEVTCSDTLYNGNTRNGVGWLLDGDISTYFQPGQKSGTTVYEVGFDMKQLQVIHGFKVVQPIASPGNEDELKEQLAYLLSSVKIEVSADNYTWESATYEDGGITIGDALGEITFIPIPADKQKAVRYIRLTMASRPVGYVDGTVPVYALRLSDFIPY